MESGRAKSTLRWWSSTSWVRLPELPSSIKEVAIGHAEPAGQRIRPWVVTEAGTFYRWNTSDQWQQVLNGTGVGNANNHAIGSDGASRWRYNYTTLSFEHDTSWTGGSRGRHGYSRSADCVAA